MSMLLLGKLCSVYIYSKGETGQAQSFHYSGFILHSGALDTLASQGKKLPGDKDGQAGHSCP